MIASRHRFHRLREFPPTRKGPGTSVVQLLYSSASTKSRFRRRRKALKVAFDGTAAAAVAAAPAPNVLLPDRFPARRGNILCVDRDSVIEQTGAAVPRKSPFFFRCHAAAAWCLVFFRRPATQPLDDHRRRWHQRRRHTNVVGQLHDRLCFCIDCMQLPSATA